MHPSVRQIDLLDDNWTLLSFTTRCHGFILTHHGKHKVPHCYFIEKNILLSLLRRISGTVSGACHMHVICDLIHSRLQKERNGLGVLIKSYEVSRLGTGKTVLRQSKPNPRINQNTKKK